VASRRVLIQLMTAAFPVFHPLMEDSDQVLLARALNDHEVLHEEAVADVPSLMQDPR
jgi:hypothetical protein